LTFIGFLLSPLSWWNDILINIPLAYVLAFPFGFISKNLFLPMIILFYWLTNILGLFLMHKGLKNMFKEEDKYSKKDLIKDIVFSILYTFIIFLLFYFGILRFPLEYFNP
jgi:hypothetical protein